MRLIFHVILVLLAVIGVAEGSLLRASHGMEDPINLKTFEAQKEFREGESLEEWFARLKHLHVLDCAKKGIRDGKVNQGADFLEELCAERKHPYGPYRPGQRYCWKSQPEWHKSEGRACQSMKQMCKEKNTLKKYCDRTGHSYGH
jgi:hypothetical protein